MSNLLSPYSMAHPREPVDPLHSQSSSDDSQPTQFTPEDVSDESDLEFSDNELGESYRLQDRGGDRNKPAPEARSVNSYTDRSINGKPRRRRGSADTTQSFQLYTPDEENNVIKKFDRRLVLFVAVLYMLSFLDRSNIGNARIAGLEKDLELSSQQYAWILTSFYITYVTFEWMAVLWKIVPAHIYICSIVLSWGITASLQSCVTSFAGLICLRILLGIGEAGFAGIPFYLSFFFKREELALRTGYFISAAPLATSFASSLAWLIVKLGEKSPIAPWRLLFLVEGFPSVFVAVLAYQIIPDEPGKAKFLNGREKKVARLRLRKQKAKGTGIKSSLKWREVLSTLADPKCYLTAFMFFGTNMAFASMPVFLPTIIKAMGHSALTSQALSAPPYLLSFAVVILTAWISDRLQSRAYFIFFHSLLSASGYFLLAASGSLGLSVWWRYAAIYPAAIGFFSVITVIITWNINNQESESKQGAAFAFMQIVGQCGPLVGTRLYPDSDGPYYVKGMSVCGGAMLVVAFTAAALRFYLKCRNVTLDDDEYGRADVVDEAQEGMLRKRKVSSGGLKFRYIL